MTRIYTDGYGGIGCLLYFFFTTEYTEAVESILKITEIGSVYSVRERSDLSVYSVVKWGLGISRVEHKDFFGVGCVFTFHEK